jgi:hypothetical protein
MAISAAQTGAVATNYFAGTISIMSATVARAAEGNLRAAAIGVQAMAKIGASGASSALIAGAQIARLSTQGGTQLLRLGVQGSTALATIGTQATATGALTVASFAKSLASMAAYTASSIASAGATALAWAAANTPLLALAGVVGGAIVVVSQLSTLVFDLGSSVRESFNKAVSESVVVFNDLKQIAMTTFGAVSDALAAGDMELAMKAAMEGVVAAFARGAGALMSKVDGLSADILNTLDAFATFAANPTLGLQMALGENPAILAKDPTLKALNARQDARLGKVTENDAARAASQRVADQKVLDIAALAAARRAEKEAGPPMWMDPKKIAAMRLGAGAAAGPDATMLAGVAGLEGVGPNGMGGQVGDLMKSINRAGSESALDDAIGEFKALKQFGRITGEQESDLMFALENAVGRMQQSSQGEVAGSFSASALGGMGVGGSLASKQLDEQKETNRILKDKLGLGEVAA